MAQIGPWASRLGDGLKLYLEGKHEQWFEAYLAAGRMGYSYGIHNAIYLLQDRINRRNSLWQRLLGREVARDSVLDDASMIPRLAELMVGSASDGKLQAFAHNTLGNCYLHGQSHGCTSDPIKAAYHYQQALSDSVASYFNLGAVYFWGKKGMIERNNTKAFDLFHEGRAKAGKDLASMLSVALYVFVDRIRKAWESILSSSSSGISIKK
jgi:TPR repeat protein